MTHRIPGPLATVVILGSALLSCLFAIRLSWPHEDGLRAKEQSLSLGELQEGTDGSLDFEILNNSSKVVEVVTVSSDCRCTVAKLYESVLHPRDTGTINVRFDTKGLVGPQVRGIHILYRGQGKEDPIRKLTLTFTASVAPDIEVDQDVLTFIEGREQVNTLRVRASRIRDISAIDVTATDAAFSVPSVTKENDVWIVPVCFHPDKWTPRRLPFDVPKLRIHAAGDENLDRVLDLRVVSR